MLLKMVFAPLRESEHKKTQHFRENAWCIAGDPVGSPQVSPHNPAAKNACRSYVRSHFFAFPSALLVVLTLLSSACGPLLGVFNDSQSKNIEVGVKEGRNGASKLDADHSPGFGQHSNMLGSKHHAAVNTPEAKLSEQGNGMQRELKGSLKRIILEGHRLKDSIEKEYRSYTGERTFEVRARNLTREWSLKVAQWAGNAEDVLQEIDSVAPTQFKVYRGPIVPRGGGEEKWGTIDNWLNEKLDFLERFYDNLGKDEGPVSRRFHHLWPTPADTSLQFQTVGGKQIQEATCFLISPSMISRPHCNPA